MIKLLVVEDDRFLGAAYKAKLTKAGFDFRLATDGEEALASLVDFLPDIILLDLVMPRKDGFTVLSEIKQDDRYKNIPIIVASNLEQKDDRDRVKQLGAVDFVTKSEMSLDEIIEHINRVAGQVTAQSS